MLNDSADVLVADGFTGNILVKSIEGAGKLFYKEIKTAFTANLKTKIGAALVIGPLRKFFKKMDYTEHGGAPLMGLKKPVFKAHGSSNARSFYSSIVQAMTYAQSGAIEALSESLAKQEAPPAL